MSKLKGIFVGVCLLAGATVYANFDYDVCNIGLLQAREIQKDMGVSEAQRTKLNQYADWFNDQNQKFQKMAEKYAAKKKAPPALMNYEGMRLLREMKRRVMSVLTAKQVIRLREITLQQAGYLALMDENVGKKVGLSTEQIKKIRSRFESDSKAAAAAENKHMQPIANKYKDKNPEKLSEAEKKAFEKDVQSAQEKIGPALEKIQDAWVTFIKATLSEKQMSTFENLQGPPFKG